MVLLLRLVRQSHVLSCPRARRHLQGLFTMIACRGRFGLLCMLLDRKKSGHGVRDARVGEVVDRKGRDRYVGDGVGDVGNRDGRDRYVGDGVGDVGDRVGRDWYVVKGVGNGRYQLDG